eukprot:GFUD01037838.1.p1 GENE.GFUD01037838.1~~GFUD01037838.1.p1  ORF type:complete len:1533 (+),score=504.50 GFUD01037838.1:53-4651(+)
METGMELSGEEKSDDSQLDVSHESEGSKSEENSSEVNTSSSKSTSESDSSKSALNSSMEKSQNVSDDAMEEVQDRIILNVNSSVEKSSPFHGFSSLDDVVGDVSDEANKELKQQMFADFGIDNDDSEEETENSDCDTDIGKIDGGNDTDVADKIGGQLIEKTAHPNKSDESKAEEVTVNKNEIKEAVEEEHKGICEEIKKSLEDELKNQTEIGENQDEDTFPKAGIPEDEEMDAENEICEKTILEENEDEKMTEEENHQSSTEENNTHVKKDQESEDIEHTNNMGFENAEEHETLKEESVVCKSPKDCSVKVPEVFNEKVSPIRLGIPTPTKSSPKKVHFSPDLESMPKKEHPRPQLAQIPPLEEFQDSDIPPNIESTPKKKGISPPLKLKIKFGKDKTGTITHGKIKSKGNYSSDEEQKNPKILEMVNQPFPDEMSDNQHLPEDLDEPFHGFPSSTIPAWVIDNFSGVDLKSAFNIKPTVFVSISSKKSQQKQQQSLPKPDNPVSVKIKAPVPPIIETPPKTETEQTEIPKLILAVPSTAPSSLVEHSTPISSKKERKRGDKNLNYIKPLYDGWVREVVWRAPADGKKSEADVYYYPPDPPGQRKLKFKSANELEGYLITSGSMYPMTFFTYKKEPVGGPEGMEIVRHSSNTPEKPVSAILASLVSPQKDTLGKRVSKPPEKLMIESTEPDTPSRASKRVIKPPDKLELDYTPVTKAARMEVSEPSHTPALKPLTMDFGKVLLKNPDVDMDAEKQESSNKMPEKGTLKLKMFSKMSVKNQLTGSDSSRNNSEAEDNDIQVLDDVKKIEMLHPQPIPSGMTITKVKKSTNETITLPGVPTIGPPPLSYERPSPSIQAPSISITPLSNRPVTMNIAPLETVKPSPKIIRPSKPTLLPCSIHCPGVTGFPSLSCTSCHCLFHPKCVGLPPSLGSSSQHEFYCNDCQPNSTTTPTNPGLQPEKPKLITPHAPGVPVAPIKTLSMDREVTKKQAEVVHKTQEIKRQEISRAKDIQKPVKAKVPPPPRPFEGQTIINIAGKKFLVIPHPAPVNIESPPPSPPPTIRAVQGFPPTQNNQNNSNQDKPVNEKLDILLKPVENYPKMPCFEVEVTPEGKYLLSAKDNNSKNLFGEDIPKKPVVPTQTPSWGNNFIMNVSGGYHAMMEVFKYLSVKERVQAACVCKLWRDIAFHQVLWRTVSLKNTRVFDWRGFAKFFNQTKSVHLDVRKMLFVKDREATWNEIISIAPEFLMLKKLELPKLGGSVLSELVAACPRLESVHAPLTTPPLNINVFSKMTQLRELKLKSSAGTMLRINQGINDLGKLAPNLTQLSLLTMEGLQQRDFDVFGTLIHLQLLEIGECHSAPANLFKTLSDLSKLQRLRLEKGTVGENVSKLANAPRLRQLELIDFQIMRGFKEGLKVIKNIQKLLIIPTYKNEVAKINTEIVEGVTKEMSQLSSFYLGVTNEWLEAMALAMGNSKVHKTGGEKECFPLSRGGQVEHISLPALYRLVCREMPGCKVKVLKMSAQATCKQFIANLDQS